MPDDYDEPADDDANSEDESSGSTPAPSVSYGPTRSSRPQLPRINLLEYFPDPQGGLGQVLCHFRDGTILVEGISPEEWDEWLAAPSCGRHYAANIEHSHSWRYQ